MLGVHLDRGTVLAKEASGLNDSTQEQCLVKVCIELQVRALQMFDRYACQGSHRKCLGRSGVSPKLIWENNKLIFSRF